jgi:hypothetical protein
MTFRSYGAEPEPRQRVRVTVRTATTINSGYGVYLGRGAVAVEKNVTQGSRDMRARVTFATGNSYLGTIVSANFIKLDNTPDFAGRYHLRKRTNRFFRLVSNPRQRVQVTVGATDGEGIYLGGGVVAVEKQMVRGSLGSRVSGSAGAGTVLSEGRGRGVGLIKLDNLPTPLPQCGTRSSFYRQLSNTKSTWKGDYTPEQLEVIRDLPPGTPTQRALIYAIRTHPDAPASANGSFDPMLAKEAERHSLHQARIQLQGHHNWDRRFRRINAALPSGLTACEVCAESWPGESMVEAAIECVNSWRQSPGHWKAVSQACPVYGYDMKRGRNGIWYATGIFGQK